MLEQSGQIKAMAVLSGVSTATLLELLTGWVGLLAAVGAVGVAITLIIKNSADAKRCIAVATRELLQAKSLEISNQVDQIELEQLRKENRERQSAAVERNLWQTGDPEPES